MEFLRQKSAILLAISSGILLALAYPPFDANMTAWVALGPLLWVLVVRPKASLDATENPQDQPRLVSTLRPRRAFFLGWVSGFVFFFLTLYWLLALPIPPLFFVFLLIGYALLAAYLGIYLGLWAAGLTALARVVGLHSVWRRIALALFASALWVGLEWVRSWMLSGFPWNFLGVSQYRIGPLIQIASVTGVYGVSFWLCFVNLALLFTVRRYWLRMMGRKDDWTELRMGECENGRKDGAGQRRVTFLPQAKNWGSQISWEFTAAMLMVMLLATNGLRLIMRTSAAPSVPLNVALVQGNIPQVLKWEEEARERILADYVALTQRAITAAPQPRLIIWPETATPEPLRMVVTKADGRLEPRYFDVRGTLSGLAEQANAYLLTGSFDITGNEVTRQTGNFYNAAFLIAPDGNLVGEPYRKMRLVPFGEYVPLEKWLPFMKWLTPIPGSFAPGKEFRIFQLSDPDVKLGAVICFEDTMPDHCREFAQRGADILVTITNDAWFKRTAGAHQHAANSVFRAVENRRPLLRSANTGMTCVISANGVIKPILEGSPQEKIFISGALNHTVEVPVNLPRTFYTKHGDVFAKSCLGIAVIGWISSAFFLKRRKKQ